MFQETATTAIQQSLTAYATGTLSRGDTTTDADAADAETVPTLGLQGRLVLLGRVQRSH